MSNKELKRKGLKNLKKNYIFLVFICLISAFLSAEFIGSLSFASRVTNKALDGQKFLIRDFIRVDNITKIEQKKPVSENKNIFDKVINIYENTLYDSYSGTIVYKGYTTVKSIYETDNNYAIPFILLSFGLYAVFWFLIINPYNIILRRFFLENRIYKKLPTERFLFLLKSKKTIKVAFGLFMRKIYLFLWSFTIVGGIIKRYSYYLVSYILAENPNIRWEEAIKLSNRMMDGHRFECFKLELSFLGWHLLGFFTFGFSNIFYLNIYKTSVMTEYYYKLRTEGKEKELLGIDLLNDKYLYEKPKEELVKEKYNDILEYINKNDELVLNIPKYRQVLLKYFGVSLLDDKMLEKYNEKQYQKIKIKETKEEMERKAYPLRLSNIHVSKPRKIFNTRNYLTCYSVYSLILIFLIFSMIGWIWEVAIRFVSEGVFVNKGTLHGPWLPIYGRGAVLILILLYYFRKKPKLEFGLIIILCGIIEYFTGLFLELIHDGQKWWDYTGYFLNLDGRICAEGLLVFGLGGLAIIYIVAPILNNFIMKWPKKVMITICLIIFTCFTIDDIYSSKHPNTGDGITSNIQISYTN